MDPGTFDVVSTLSTSATTIVDQLMSILTVVVPVVIGFVAAKIGITKGIGVLKSLVGKG